MTGEATRIVTVRTRAEPVPAPGRGCSGRICSVPDDALAERQDRSSRTAPRRRNESRSAAFPASSGTSRCRRSRSGCSESPASASIIIDTVYSETGEFLWATPTITRNAVSGIDGATGQVTENAERIFTASGRQVPACLHASGGKDREAGAYSPRTNTIGVPRPPDRGPKLVSTRVPEVHHDARHELAPQ